MIVGRAALETPAVVAGLDDVAVVGEPIEQRGGHLRITEHARPFAEGEVGGDHDRGALVEAADEVEEELASGLGEGQIAELVQHDEVQPRELIGEPPWPAAAHLGLEPVDQIDHVIEATARAGTDTASRDGDGEVGFTGAGAADQDGVALLRQEVTLGEVADQRFVDRGGRKVEVGKIFGQRSRAIVSWYLIERACFSLISALSRSPTMRCGSCWRLTAVAITSSKAAFMP